MPKKEVVVTTTYSCNICFEEYQSLDDAVQCEGRGVALPEFKEHEVVELINIPADKEATVASGHKTAIQNGMKAVVHSDDFEEKHNPHQLPAYYEVWIATPNGKYDREITGFSRENLKKAVVEGGSRCPLCLTEAILTEGIMSRYLCLMDGLPHIGKVPMYECKKCNAEFFTDSQSRYVELATKREMKRMRKKLANTKQLIKKKEFQYS